MNSSTYQNRHHGRPVSSRQVTGICGECPVPGDKSISHRALILASQVKGTTRITGLLESDDVLNTATALNSLGVSIRKDGAVWEVDGVGIGGLSESKEVLDMGNSGTSARLLMGLVTPYPFTTFFTGDESLRRRPMGRVVVPLSQMGATITSGSGERLPLAVIGTNRPHAIEYTLPVASAQVKSAIMLAALNTPGTTTVIEKEPTRDHTENMLKHFGFKVEVKGKVISLAGKQRVSGNHEVTVPSDPSSAAFPIVAALICSNSQLHLKNVCINPLRTGLFITLKEMGADLRYLNERVVAGEKVADIEIKSSALKGVAVPAERAPSMIDEYPILAVAAAFATGETVMHGLSELRVKESDRLSAIVTMLSACGAKAHADGDNLYITGGKPKGGATIKTNLDHRIAMSALVMGMATKEPVEIDDASAIATSFPGFVEVMNGVGANISSPHRGEVGRGANGKSAHQSPHPTPPPKGEGIHPLIIAIDGPAASGKGTLARRIAEHFGLEYLDTGSLYRAVGMKLIYGGQDPHDKQAAVNAVQTIDADDLANPRLRQERIGQAASIVSAFPEVRQALLEFQRNFAKGGYYYPSPRRGEDGRGADNAHTYPIKNILQNARNLRKSMTNVEQLLWYFLRKEQFGVKFRKQHPVGKYIADFACLNPKLIIELDGGQHNEEKAIKKDEKRTKFLEQQGFQVLRFWNNDVLQNTEGVLETIWNQLHPTQCPPPNLPPMGGGIFRGAVLDGRDIGTVVCPDADVKFFLTATLYARAKRRHKELSGQGIEVVFESVLEDLRERDERDEKRAIAPLKPADDAILMDTSDMDASEVFEKTCAVIKKVAF